MVDHAFYHPGFLRPCDLISKIGLIAGINQSRRAIACSASITSGARKSSMCMLDSPSTACTPICQVWGR